MPLTGCIGCPARQDIDMNHDQRLQVSSPAAWCCPPPSGRGFIALLEAFRPSGGTAPGEVVGHLLKEHRVGDAVSLARLIHTDQVFGFEWRRSLWIPMFQFDANDLGLKARVQQLREELPPPASGWALAWWFAGPNERLGGCRPIDLLETDFEAVLHAARARLSTRGVAAALAVAPQRWAHEFAAPL